MNAIKFPHSICILKPHHFIINNPNNVLIPIIINVHRPGTARCKIRFSNIYLSFDFEFPTSVHILVPGNCRTTTAHKSQYILVRISIHIER